jgi:hypothetical protein
VNGYLVPPVWLIPSPTQIARSWPTYRIPSWAKGR